MSLSESTVRTHFQLAKKLKMGAFDCVEGFAPFKLSQRME